MVPRPKESSDSIDFDARRGPRVVELGGPAHVVLHVFGDLIARVDSLHRTLRHAHRAVNALRRIDYEVVARVVDAVHRTSPNAGRVLRADTRFGYDIGHDVLPLLARISPKASLAR